MTNKTEDRFYFGKPGEPESRKINDDLRRASVHISARNREGIEILETLWDAKNRGELSAGQESYLGKLTKEARDIGWRPVGSKFSRPGQPERFGLEGACWEGYEPVGTKQKDGRTVPNCVPKDKNEQPEEFAAPSEDQKQMIRKASKPSSRALSKLRDVVREYARNATKRPGTIAEHDYYRMKSVLESATRGDRSGVIASGNESGVRDDIPAEIWYWAGGDVLRWSKPGQPDKFDASSLERGSFAEASKSPMLGKLLSEKAMPDGGWRAVQVGSDTLVISFEDADLARDFGRRVASKGYSATSPVATTGRYWNVEVKNG